MNVALIGYGYWGPNVAKNIYANKQLKLHTICDLKESRLEKAKNLYVEHSNYEVDYKKLLAKPEIQAIAVAVETSAHFQIVKDALNAGKHVYVEKPFTATVKEAEELTALASSKGLIIHVDHIMMYHPCIQKIRELITSGDLGELLYIEAMRMNLGQIKKDVSAMADLAVHDLSIIDYLSDGKEPFYIKAVGEKKYNPKESLTFLMLRYHDFIAHIQSSWISPLKERKLIVAGTKKMVVFDDIKPSTEKLTIYDKGVDVLAGSDVEYEDYAVKTRVGDIWIPYIPEQDALYNSLEHFANCIRTNKQSDSGPEQAIRVLKILEHADNTMNA
ncbi:Gfo/Idh/MocA family protein [Methylotenera mobilis]|uniref:Gfo/Idh/MocA family protein n=1 Tax=Methylotenera mobilis TaxID=359408 RepID=UPI000378F372|nr:Gfo/Idh/MocA family oxidoreductase [Methylotenera mobilis]